MKCLGEKCKNNCCSKNFIGLSESSKTIDKNTFNQILLGENEVKNIIASGNGQYLEKNGDEYFISLNKDRSCKAFKDGKCLIYDVRPDVCKLYPCYFDPFAGIFIDKRCPISCDYVINNDNEKFFELIENRVNMFKNIEGKRQREYRASEEYKNKKKTQVHDVYNNYLANCPYLSLKDNKLYYDDICLYDLATKYGTPLELAFIDRIRDNILYMKKLFDDKIEKYKYGGKYYYAYAAKANYYSEVVITAQKHSDIIETSSAYDTSIIIELVNQGIIKKGYWIICNGFLTKDYLKNIEHLLKKGLRVTIILENIDELELIKTIKFDKLEVGVRYNCDFEARIITNDFRNFDVEDTRFGFDKKQIIEVCNQIKNNPKLKLSTFHFHFGGVINNIDNYINGLTNVFDLYSVLKKEHDDLNYFNLGGGFPTRSDIEWDFDFEQLVDNIIKMIEYKCQMSNIPNPNLITELGRYTVADHGIYIYKVDIKKTCSNSLWYIINSSLMNMIPDILLLNKKFIILPINLWDKDFQSVYLGGETCDPDDRYYINKKNEELFLPVFNEQEELYIAVLAIGAYQELLAGIKGVHHCIIPEGSELIVYKNKDKKVCYEISKKQTFNDVLKKLDYKNRRYTNRIKKL